jgi:transposase
MNSIVRRGTGEDWRVYVMGLMREEGGVEADGEPTDEEIRRFDKKRKTKKVSNGHRESKADPTPGSRR